MARDGKVAIVDNDQAVRDSLRLLLDIMGYPADVFDSAANFLAADARSFTCLILDHHMPNMTGLQLAEQLRAYGDSLPIMLITGSPSLDIISRAAELGIARVLEKPPSEEDLSAFIEASRG